MLAAAGYGEFDPLRAMTPTTARRRIDGIEIILLPNLDELPKLPKDLIEG
ncbi:MAG: hypothetical protein R3E66_12915 [bacterium]